jgi:hypothetical protein
MNTSLFLVSKILTPSPFSLVREKDLLFSSIYFVFFAASRE